MLKKMCGIALTFCSAFGAMAQTTIPLNDLSAFEKTADNWRIVGGVSADLSTDNKLVTTPGTGVLACIHEKGIYGNEFELYTKVEHGDADLEFDFLLAKGANSGVYLQGRYELQLYDSWGKKSARYDDVGGIYERWNDKMPQGQKGFEGIAPRTNAAKSPGLWQHMKISFQAPRFDANGKKIQNAKFLKVELNGTVLHENVEVTGPTRGSMKDNEVKMGPLRFQGDHSSIAFRNIQLNNFNQPAATLTDLTYNVYYGNYPPNTDISKLKVGNQGKTDQISWDVSKEKNEYIIVYKGNLNVPADGKYTLTHQISGTTLLKIDGKVVAKDTWYNANQTIDEHVELTKGTHSLEIINNKRDGWLKPAMGFWVSGPGFRETAFHSMGSLLANQPTDPILVNADKPTVLRSFMDFKPTAASKNYRVVHAVSVGNPAGLHYTYDMDRAALMQVWRGDFLDATPMWENRGDGSSRPMGKALPLSVDFLVNKPAGNNSAWQTDTTGSNYRPMGYKMESSGIPTFMFNAFGASATDAIRVKDGKSIERTITFENAPANLMIKIADGKKIEKLDGDMYAVGDKTYFVKIANAKITETGGMQQLVVPATNGKVSYELIF